MWVTGCHATCYALSTIHLYLYMVSYPLFLTRSMSLYMRSTWLPTATIASQCNVSKTVLADRKMRATRSETYTSVGECARVLVCDLACVQLTL